MFDVKKYNGELIPYEEMAKFSYRELADYAQWWAFVWKNYAEILEVPIDLLLPAEGQTIELVISKTPYGYVVTSDNELRTIALQDWFDKFESIKKYGDNQNE